MGGFARDGVAAVAADGEVRGDGYGAVGCEGLDAGGDAVLLDEGGGLPAHAESEGGEVRGFGGEEVEEVPLRHECDELGLGGEMAEVGYAELLAADEDGELGDARVWEGEEFFEEAELVEEFECGGVDGVAAEVAEEVFVFFEDGDGDALAGEQEAEHDACGASADDAAGGGGRVEGGRHLW